MMKVKICTILIIFLLCIATAPSIAQEQEAQEKNKDLAIKSWLLLGPFTSPLPAFHESKKRGYAVEDVLNYEEIEIAKLKPKPEGSLEWHNGRTAQWKELHGEEDIVTLPTDNKNAATAYLGVYLEVGRWTKSEIIIHTPQTLRVFVDGEVVATKAKVDSTEEGKPSVEGRKTSTALKLETGLHLILLKTVYDPSSNSDWTLKSRLSFEENSVSSLPPRLALYHLEKMTITHLLDGPKVGGISISPDGTLAAITIRKTLPPGDESESWVEIYNTADDRPIQTYRGGMSISDANWAPSGKRFSYVTRKKSKGTIWIVDLEKGTSIPLIEEIENLNMHVWSPDGSFIIYSVTEEAKEDKRGVKRFQNMADRQPWWRNRTYLYKVSIPGGISQRLTAGELSTSLDSFNPDGKSLLFTRRIEDYSDRPYYRIELYSLDLETLKAQLLWDGRWLNSAQWSPQGDKILILGSPSAFGKIGWNLPKGRLPNETETEAYLFNPETKKAEPLTRDFDPTITQAIWSKTENCIYFTTIDRSYHHLYRYDLEEKTFDLIDCGVEVIGRLDLAKNAPTAVYTGSSATVPPKAYLIDLKDRKYRILHDPEEKDYADVTFGKVERWTFKNKRGTEIEGRIYYPPDFDPERKYPCIVYYYGGVSPVDRSFGGRYPKNLYAAQGYVIYVLQPSGAVGFGQEFSSYHVNDWGIVVADEIIDGVKKFLAAHSFVDPDRVGCIGASYGGFMTMLLLTRTDIFAAGIAHAGISSISSYWGEGFWGYWYNSISAADSFPWNRKDIYVNQSALFHADKITTPLLLLHGSDDTNVPSGESTQLYTALKLLGKEVEYIQVSGQNHWIMQYNKRKLWTKTIMAWFDKWLRNQPEWWEDLYSEK